MKYKFYPEAEAEYISAIRCYSKISKSLSESFIKTIEISINHILEFPKSFPLVENNIRKFVVNKFPYKIFYLIEQDFTISIYAIMHTSQKPDNWENRVET